jgi:hypothetical protein
MDVLKLIACIILMLALLASEVYLGHELIVLAGKLLE